MRRGHGDERFHTLFIHRGMDHNHEWVSRAWYHRIVHHNSRVIIMTAIWAIITGAVVSLIALSVLYNLTLHEEENEKVVVTEVLLLEHPVEAEAPTFHDVITRHREAHLGVRQ